MSRMRRRTLAQGSLGAAMDRALGPRHTGRLGARALVAGWFSFPDRKATFGDTRAKDVVCSWLSEAGIPFDVAVGGGGEPAGVQIDTVDPAAYSIFIFVCGPWEPDGELLDRFRHCLKVGVDLSVTRDGNNGFDFLLPRDSPSTQNPDLAFAAPLEIVPVVAVVLVHPQPMYGKRQRHDSIKRVVDDVIAGGHFAPLWLDTIITAQPGVLTDANQFESLIKRSDAVVSTRLHGLVFALKNDVPVVAIDPIAGGAKVSAQAKAIGWPLVIPGESLTEARLLAGIEACLAGSMAEDVTRCRRNAEAGVLGVKSHFLGLLRGP